MASTKHPEHRRLIDESGTDDIFEYMSRSADPETVLLEYVRRA
jgi:hypothetical protein